MVKKEWRRTRSAVADELEFHLSAAIKAQYSFIQMNARNRELSATRPVLLGILAIGGKHYEEDFDAKIGRQ